MQISRVPPTFGEVDGHRVEAEGIRADGELIDSICHAGLERDVGGDREFRDSMQHVFTRHCCYGISRVWLHEREPGTRLSFALAGGAEPSGEPGLASLVRKGGRSSILSLSPPPSTSQK